MSNLFLMGNTAAGQSPGKHTEQYATKGAMKTKAMQGKLQRQPFELLNKTDSLY